ncbi:N-acetyl-gamma-glutamyl-phosphate reductase [Pendulispora albinea]|uniref:N-acetyl-gamma-glutamyl-phosphate reductase n=1 Tax=Pendulispora albinea TaxID=2741071 RepID=A0ABZ2LRP7_9BACT
MLTAVVVGAAGYVGGEVLRLLLGHPNVTVRAALSRTFAGHRVDGVHPNLRGATNLIFAPSDDIPASDVLFLATEHGRSAELLSRSPHIAQSAAIVIDLSADFRLTDEALHQGYYPKAQRPLEWATTFVPGWPERHREALRTANRISVPGCMAMAGMLALHPLAAADILEPDVIVDAKTGSSGSGATALEQNLHAERSGAMRVFAPHGHRHEAEMAQSTGLRVHMTATGVEAVRGVQVLCHARSREPIEARTLYRIYREAYGNEPFVRVVAQRQGRYRLPEPKILLGSNYCDVGFALDPEGHRLTLIAALDNLMKGGAGNGIQCLNVRMGWSERLGLEFQGLHP